MADIQCNTCGITRNIDLATQISDKYFCSPSCIQAYYLGKSIRADISVVTKVDASLSNTILLASNDDRKMVTFYNNSTASLFIKFGSLATVDSFSLKIGAGDYMEFPYPCFIGRIDGFWDAVNGSVMVTEID
jgi:hypothetical protein